MSAPQTRTVCQHTGTRAACPEADRLRQERDDAMHQLRLSAESNAGLAKWAGAYQEERDELRAERDALLIEVAALREVAVRAQELGAELASIRADLVSARAERDTYRSAVAR